MFFLLPNSCMPYGYYITFTHDFFREATCAGDRRIVQAGERWYTADANAEDLAHTPEERAKAQEKASSARDKLSEEEALFNACEDKQSLGGTPDGGYDGKSIVTPPFPRSTLALQCD